MEDGHELFPAHSHAGCRFLRAFQLEYKNDQTLGPALGEVSGRLKVFCSLNTGLHCGGSLGRCLISFPKESSSRCGGSGGWDYPSTCPQPSAPWRWRTQPPPPRGQETDLPGKCLLCSLSPNVVTDSPSTIFLGWRQERREGGWHFNASCVTGCSSPAVL